MKKILMLILAMMLVISGCGTGQQASQTTPEPSTDAAQATGTDTTAPAEADRYDAVQEYKGVYSGELTTLNYLTTASTNEFGVAANFIDTLIEYDQYGVVKPSLATDWSVSEDGLVWTFKIREGVKWYDNEGNEVADVTAQDFVDSMKYILNPTNESKTVQIAYDVIKNAHDFYDGKITDFSQVGVKAVDEYTLEYTLEQPTPYFLSMLTYVCFFPVNGEFLESAGDRFGTDNEKLLYNGAYILTTFEPQTKRVLTKNENYWDKDNVHIEKLTFKYNKEADALASELYLRGEISMVEIPSSSIDEWMNDPARQDLFRPATTSFYTYFFTLNFDPHFEAAFEPDNWKVAVNNTSFRKALFHALDKRAAMLTSEPYNPEKRLSSTITPKNFTSVDGQDYVMISDLANFVDKESFNIEEALKYKEQAMKELDGKATFPVKLYMPYNSGSSDATNRAQVIQQQIQGTLGDDFIEVYLAPYPPTGFLNATRRAGNYSLMEVNWGPDYADPETYTDPFSRGSNYNFPEYCTEVDENGNNVYEVYEAIVNEAKAERVDIAKRYELFAKAEAYLIDKAFVVPYALGGGGYVSSKLDPFEAMYSPFGVSSERYKLQHILAKPMNNDDYDKAIKVWQEDREKALKQAE